MNRPKGPIGRRGDNQFLRATETTFAPGREQAEMRTEPAHRHLPSVSGALSRFLTSLGPV